MSQHRTFLPALLLPVLLLLLSACSTLPSTPTAHNWQSHQDNVLSHAHWQLQGRLNIRTDAESNTVSINWQQSQQEFLINLSGTLGLGATQIQGNEQQVSVEKAGEAPISAATLEEVSRYYLGYEFPASALHYWVRGIPAPDSSNLDSNTLDNGNNPTNLELDNAQRLKHLTQLDSQHNEWQLEYDRYKMVNGVFLPGRIKMQHPSYRLTFIISQWQLTADI